MYLHLQYLLLEIMAKRNTKSTSKNENIITRCDKAFKDDATKFAKSLGDIGLSGLVRLSINEKMKKEKWQAQNKKV